MNDIAHQSKTIRLQPPEHRIERRAIGWWALQAALCSVPLLAATIIAHVLWGGQHGWFIVAIVAAVVLLVATVFVEPLWRYRVHRWQTTNTAVYARSGWLVKEWRASPLSRVQTVDALQGPLEQLLGLSTLRVTTASSYGAIDIGGLDKHTAARVADELTALTESTPGDAT
ncbi:MAG TPA: PH domain-containing protein [Candidatus Yaniella excrementavium]|nr:PH domain-containing protein [Candidatus Yaniella excrementavium]